jgi:hypothetical protein
LARRPTPASAIAPAETDPRERDRPEPDRSEHQIGRQREEADGDLRDERDQMRERAEEAAREQAELDAIGLMRAGAVRA